MAHAVTHKVTDATSRFEKTIRRFDSNRRRPGNALKLGLGSVRHKAYADHILGVALSINLLGRKEDLGARPEFFQRADSARPLQQDRLGTLLRKGLHLVLPEPDVQAGACVCA